MIRFAILATTLLAVCIAAPKFLDEQRSQALVSDQWSSQASTAPSPEQSLEAIRDQSPWAVPVLDDGSELLDKALLGISRAATGSDISGREMSSSCFEASQEIWLPWLKDDMTRSCDALSAQSSDRDRDFLAQTIATQAAAWCRVGGDEGSGRPALLSRAVPGLPPYSVKALDDLDEALALAAQDEAGCTQSAS